MKLLILGLVAFINIVSANIISVTLVGDDECSFHSNFLSNAAAVGILENKQNAIGSDVLRITGQREDLYLPEQIARAMGCVQAALHYNEIYAYWKNYEANEYGPKGPSPQLKAFMQQQLEWTRTQIAAQNSTVPFFSALGLFIAQFEGLRDAYFAVAPSNQTLTELDLYMLNSVGDLEDLDGLFPNKNSLTRKARIDMALSNNIHYDPIDTNDKLTDCSALIRVIGDVNNNVTDIYAGQATWRHYYALLRSYNVFTYPQTLFPIGTVSFSSSPGLLHSKDDFYATDSLVIMETTNSIMNSSLWSSITPSSLLSWQRALVANALSGTAEQWCNFFNRFSSGTYSNQWMVLDLTVFNAGAPLPNSNLLWITESVPGYQQSMDVTSVLKEQGYWASYNIPYISSIYNISGYPSYLQKYGPQYSYTNNSRALIFARNVSQGDADTVAGMQALMRYNNFQNDPLGRGDAVLGSVSSRADLLNNSKPSAFGGIDAKITAASMIMPSNKRNGIPTINVLAEFGPTHDQQVVFDWSKHPEWSYIVHNLTPTVFNFNYTLITSTPGEY